MWCVRQLRDLTNEILEKKYHGDTKAMARALLVDNMDVRRLAGKDPGSGRNQQKIFELTLRLLPICKELGIDPARELNTPMARDIVEHAIIQDGQRTYRRAASDVREKAGETKKTGGGPVPARRDRRRRKR